MKGHLLVACLAPLLQGSVVAFDVGRMSAKRMACSTVLYQGGDLIVESDDGPFSSSDYVERARVCASKFGKCSVQELETLKQDLHRERLQHMVYGLEEGKGSPDMMEHQLLEEELNMQLELLKNEMPKATLFPDISEEEMRFPEVEAPMAELPHLKDGTKAKSQEEKLENTNKAFWQDVMFEEGVMDSLEICAIIALAAVIPAVVFG